MATFMVTLKYTCQSQECRNILYWNGGTLVHADMQDLVDQIRTVMVNRWQNRAATTSTWYGAAIRDVSTPGLPSIDYVPTSGSVVGSSTYDPLANQTALIVHFLANAAPPNRLRKYIPGLTESQLTGGQFVAACVSAFKNWADDLLAINTINGKGAALVCPQWAGDNSYVTGVNILETSRAVAIPGTQRSRRVGVGI